MLSRSTFSARFGVRPIFGMVHLRPLPGAPGFGGSMQEVIDAALEDARSLEAGGCPGLVVENFGDRPFFKGRVEAETVAAMTRVMAEVRREVRLPVGVNVLRNDALSALAIAAATGAEFVRVNVHTGATLTDQGIIEGQAAETLRRRAVVAPEVAIFADHLVKHAAPLTAIDPIQSANDLRHRGLADAILVTGPETGRAPSAGHFRLLRDAVDAPLLVASGLTPDNAADFSSADGAIAGTWVKRQGRVENPVDVERVRRLVERFRSGN
jgi:membrane complex biogenesis BtpA family protein